MEPNMKHRKRPLWSLPTCQSALHRDCLLPLLMCCTDRPGTHMQTHPEWRKSSSVMSLTGVGIQACPRGEITMTTSSVGKAWVYYSIFGFQLASMTASFAGVHIHICSNWQFSRQSLGLGLFRVRGHMQKPRRSKRTSFCLTAVMTYPTTCCGHSRHSKGEHGSAAWMPILPWTS